MELQTITAGPGTHLPGVAPPAHCVSGVGPLEPGRERVERYIAGIFNAAYGARVLEYLPFLCTLEREGALMAALGLRSAANDTLFCEQYLDTPVESAILDEFGQAVDRSRVLELGNLVASSHGQAVFLYLLVTAALGRFGVRYLIFAANRAVRTSIRRCGFETRIICDASPSRLGRRASEWGSYYDGDPKVVLADIRGALSHGWRQDAIADIWQHESETIEALAADIRLLGR